MYHLLTLQLSLCVVLPGVSPRWEFVLECDAVASKELPRKFRCTYLHVVLDLREETFDSIAWACHSEVIDVDNQETLEWDARGHFAMRFWRF